MITLLWMLYLAFLILFTYWTIIYELNIIKRGSSNSSSEGWNIILQIILAIMWSAWYFYFLH